MNPECSHVQDDLADLVAGDSATIARHADHLASCDDCRDARHEASQLAAKLGDAGGDYVMPANLIDRVLAAAGSGPIAAPAPILPPAPAPVIAKASQPIAKAPTAASEGNVIPITRKQRPNKFLAIGATAALAIGGIGIYAATRGGGSATDGTSLPGGKVATVKTIDRAGKDAGGLEIKDGNGWRLVRVGETLDGGAELRTDKRTRASVELADGTRYVLDHETGLKMDNEDGRHASLLSGRIVADVVHIDARPAAIDTPMGRVDVVGTRFALTATPKLTVVQVVRGAVVLTTASGSKDNVRAGEEGVIEDGKLAVNAAPGLAREVEWSELGNKQDTQKGAGLGSLKAYKPGESRDRDWNLALASHDVKVRIVGPVARTEITETFRNDSDQQLEGVYQFPLPADAQIDALSLDVKDSPGGFEDGAFVDKKRAQKIWNGVIEKATPKKLEIAQDEIIWVDGSWRDPAMLDWKRGGRFELRIFPIPSKGARTIKIAYTQIVTPRGPWRQYIYPLPHSADGSTVADQMTVDVEVRGAQPGQVRTAGYDMNPDPVRADVNALTLKQTGFVPRGDLVVDYRAQDGDAELRAWTYAGNFAVAPDAKLAEKKNVGIDDKVIEAQRSVASDNRATAVVALRPKLPRWREEKERDYMIVVDSSQSMVGERFARSTEMVSRLIEQMDRRDRVAVMACDSECREMGALRSPSIGVAKETAEWLTKGGAAGASDIVGSIRTAASKLPASQRERWVLFVGDGFASTGFRKAGDVEAAIKSSTQGINVSTVGIGTDADATVMGAVARGGGGSYVAWVPGQSVKTAAIASLESTYGSALRNATVELPSGLTDVAPTILPTIRSGEEVLLAARLTGDVNGDVIVKGTVGGEKFEQRYPVKLAASAGAGNRFVPRLWASLAIDQLERGGKGDDRTKIVALSQGYGVMSKETSLLVLESQAMFDAFGVDRSVPNAKWTGQDSLDEVTAGGSMQIAGDVGGATISKDMSRSVPAASRPMPAKKADAKTVDATSTARGGDDDKVSEKQERPPAMDPAPMPKPKAPMPVGRAGLTRGGMGGGMGYGQFAMRRTWVRVPSISLYDNVSSSITKAIGDAEKSLVKKPDSRESYRALVQSLSYAGELERANTVAAKWLDRDKLDPLALGYQADLLGRDGKREQALRMLAGVVDLDADRAAPHERMVTAYEHVGRMTQACSHRIALSALSPKDAKVGAAAVRCLRSLSHDDDAALVLKDLADDATRTAVDKELLAAVPATSKKNDVVIDARWDGNAEDLDISVVTPDGTRVSWMGGRSDVRVADATSTQKEQLAIQSIKRGNYLVEISRGGATAGTGTVHGTLDIVALGSKKSLPFELIGTHKTVGRLSINLEEHVETIDLSAPASVQFGTISNPAARRVMLARSGDIQRCFDGSSSGRMSLTITVQPGGSTTTQATGGNAAQNQCVAAALNYMHVEGTPAGVLRVPLTWRAQYTAD